MMSSISTRAKLAAQIRSSQCYGLFTLTCLALGILTALWQVQYLGSVWILNEQQEKVQYILDGVALSPYQYRPLAYYVAGIAAIVTNATGVHYAFGFVLLRMLQNAAIFAAFIAYWRAWNINWAGVAVGIALLLYGMSNALTDSDLAFDTYADLLWYAVAGWAILTERDRLVPVVALFAAASRETSIFIPLLHIITTWKQRERLPVALLSLMLWSLTYGSIRITFGPRAEFGAYGHEPGLEMIAYNLSRGLETALNLLATVSIIPAIVIFGWRLLPVLLRHWAIVMVPAWLVFMLWFGVWAETRLFLAPFAVIGIPAIWFVLRRTEL